MTDITANVIVSMPSQLFTMARSFKAVANGKIYIGKIDTDPVNPENQIQVYVENEDGSHVPVSQPIIINAAGYPVYNGQIAKFVTVQGHSMAVYDAYGAQQFYFPNVLKYDPDQFRVLVEAEGGAQYIGNSAIAVRDMGSLKAAPWVKAGQFYDLQSYVSLENGGRGYWMAVNTSTVTPNGIDIVQSTSKPSVSFVFQPVNGTVDIRQVGAIEGVDVTAILNRVHDNPNYRVVLASRLNSDAAFICSSTVILKKSFIGTGLPQFDFASTAVDTPSFYTGDVGSTNDVEYSGFEIKNSQHVALLGKGDRVLITRVKCTNSRKQGINWQGINWKVTYCLVSGVSQEFGIVNGGISRDVEIAFNYVEYTNKSGAIELGYTCSDARVHHNSIRNCYIGIQVYQKTTGSVNSALDVSIEANNIKNSTLYAIHVNCGEGDPAFKLIGLYISDNRINTAGTLGINIEKGATDILLTNNDIRNVTANIAIQITSFDGYCLIQGGFISLCNQGIYMQQDGIDVDGVRFYNITYDVFLWPADNDFKSQAIRNCYIRTFGRDFIRNFNYKSYPSIKDFNNIKMPLNSFEQMSGANVVAGQLYYIDNAPNGGSPGFYVISSGIVGSGAAARNLAAIAST